MTDDDPIRDLLGGALALPVVLVAHALGVFDALADRPRSAGDLARDLGLADRPTAAILEVCLATGLLARDAAGVHHLTDVGARALTDDSPVAYGAYLDLLREASAMTTVESVRDAMRTDRPQADRLGVHDRPGDPARTRLLTEAMHDRGRLAAATWPSLVDLGDARTLLDLGGGSGIHAHAALRRWPDLRAVVLDRPEVCELAEAAAGAAGLADRLTVVAGDYEDLTTPLPEADVHLWSEVLHNRDPATCRSLLGRSHAELAPGGWALVHEMPLDDGGGPLAVAAASVNMLLWTRTGRQHRRGDLLAWLGAAGFADVGHRPVVGHFELLTGRKAP